jgi:hypothetical protein
VLRATAGQILVNDALPEDLRDYSRVLDKDGMKALMRQVAQKYPDRYRDISKRLADLGRYAASESGGYSFGIEHMAKTKAGRKYEEQVRKRVTEILNNPGLSPEERNKRLIHAAGSVQTQQMKEVYEEALAAGNPIALQVASGARGNKANVASLLGTGDLLYTDHRDNVMPLPVLHNYSQGLRPMEYWAGAYGARRGLTAVKFSTRDAGFLGKQLNQIAHRLMVVNGDDPREGLPMRGLPVDTDDPDNEGALLAHDVGGYRRNTVLTPKILKALGRAGHDRILVRSPAVGGSPDGGVYARDVGVREYGVLPGRGEQVGLTAAQALSEPVSQGQLGAKHGGGVAGQDRIVGGFAAINQLIQTPARFKGGATHATKDGTVERVEPAPAGGQNVWVDGEQHYVPPGAELKVKRGDHVEAGDVLTNGWPDHSVIAEHKGLGEGKRYFINSMREAMRESGMTVNRRNVELLARGLVNYVRMTDEYDDHVPDDVVPYATLEHAYVPRDTAVRGRPGPSIAGQYLESPVLHYTIGTKVRPSVLRELKRFGVEEVVTHPEPPPFVPESVRGMSVLHHDPDWMTRMYGSGLKSSLLQAVHRGGTSDELGTSFVPGLARSVDFGRVGLVRSPQPGTPLPPEGTPFPEAGVRPKALLDLNTVKQPERKKTWASGLGALLKLSADRATQAREARELIAKVAADMAPPEPPAPKEPPAPGPTWGGAMGAAGGAGAGVGAGGQPPPPPPPEPGGMGDAMMRSARQGVEGPPQGNLPGGWKPAPPPGQPATTPGHVHPARQDAFRGYGQAPVTGGHEYALEGGMLDRMDSPEQLAAFVEGGGFGGLPGQAVRFGSVFNPAAVGTLTSGSPYAPGEYGTPGQELPWTRATQTMTPPAPGSPWGPGGGPPAPEPEPPPAAPDKPDVAPGPIRKWVAENPGGALAAGLGGLLGGGVLAKALQTKLPGFLSNRPEDMGRIGRALSKVPVLRTLLTISPPGTPPPGTPVPPAVPGAKPGVLSRLFNNPVGRTLGRVVNNPFTRTALRGLGPAAMGLDALGVLDAAFNGQPGALRQKGLADAQQAAEIITDPGWIKTPLGFIQKVFTPFSNINSTYQTLAEAKEVHDYYMQAQERLKRSEVGTLNSAEYRNLRLDDLAKTRPLTRAEQQEYDSNLTQIRRLTPIRDELIAKARRENPAAANLLVWGLKNNAGKAGLAREQAAARDQAQDPLIVGEFEKARAAFDARGDRSTTFDASPEYRAILEKFERVRDYHNRLRNGQIGVMSRPGPLGQYAAPAQNWERFVNEFAPAEAWESDHERMERKQRADEKARGEAWKSWGDDPVKAVNPFDPGTPGLGGVIRPGRPTLPAPPPGPASPDGDW